MAENWTRAFGRYLKTLRERRKLSLENVRALSQAFADTLNKGYLSRCENGRQRLAFSKVIPLSRIYEVPADVLLERMELDMELDRVGSPETEGMTFSELTTAAAEARDRGLRWHAYAYLRDATCRAGVDPPTQRFRDQTEQTASGFMSCATGAMMLERLRFALHEYRYVENTGTMGPALRPVLLRQLSHVHRELGDLGAARTYAETALCEAKDGGDKDFLGYILTNRAMQAHMDNDLELAVEFFKEAHDAYQDTGLEPQRLTSLNNLAQVYFDLRRYGAARRALAAAERTSRRSQHNRVLALNQILIGEIEALEHHEERATRRWREAASIAKRLNDKVLRFKAEYLLFKQAQERGDDPVARSIGRRLRRLAPWIPKSTPELRDFEELISGPAAGS